MKRRMITKVLGVFLAGAVTLSSVPALQVRAEEETEENIEEVAEPEADEENTEEQRSVSESEEPILDNTETGESKEEELTDASTETEDSEEERNDDKSEFPDEADTEDVTDTGEDAMPDEEPEEEQEEEADGDDEIFEEDLSDWIVQAGGFEGPEKESVEFAGVYYSSADSYATAKKRINNALVGWADKVELSDCNISLDEFRQLYTSVINANPELFYVGTKYQYTSTGGMIKNLYPQYKDGFSADDVEGFRSKAQSIVARMEDSWTDLEKALFLHDYIVQHVEYEKTEPYSKYSAYDAMIGGEAVCNGYALEYTYLLGLAGIESEVVVSDSLQHAWNLLRLNGKYYYVDSTWDDHGTSYTRKSYCSHEFFLLNRSDFAQEHSGSDWYGTKSDRNVYDNVETAGNYSGYFWQDIYSALPLNGTKTAYCSGGKVHIFDFVTMTETATYDYQQGKWRDFGSSGWSYTASYDCFSVLNGSWYYLVPDGIYHMTTNGVSNKVYTLSSSEASVGYLYGLMNEDGRLYYEIAVEPNGSTVRSGYYNGVSNVPVESVALDVANISLEVGKTQTLRATVLPANATNGNVQWGSSNESVATVSNGTVTGKSAGTAVITVTSVSGGKSATCNVKVTQASNAGNNTDYSQEKTTRGFVYRMYDVVLGRQPDENGLNDWVSRLNSGQATAVDIVYGFFYSPEYQNKGKTNSEIVTDCYQAMLGREPDAAGYVYWLDRLNVGMTPEAIFAGFVGSQEFMSLCSYYGIAPGQYILTAARDQNYERTYFVYRLYQNCLGRTPDAAGQEDWCAQLGRGESGSNVAYGFVFSPEYWGRHVDNTEYVSMLYKTILGREGETAGMADWINQLNYTYTREHVLNGFLYSREFAQQCSVAGIHVGSPVAEPDSGREWQYNIQILQLCNQQRTNNGLSNLVTREDIWRDVAMVRANELTTSYSHTRPDGSECWTAYYAVGINNPSAENIAAGYSSPQAAMNGWMNSEGHRSNILGNSKVLATGYSYSTNDRYGHYWSQNFTR